MRRPPIGAPWVRLQTALARDATARLSAGSALVLGPHPDDESIGCGLLLTTKAARGEQVSIALATDGGGGWFSTDPEPSGEEIVRIRRGEWNRALDDLGVAAGHRYELGFADGGLADHESEVAERIAALLVDLTPSQVFVTSPDDLHADHRALGRAACAAVRSVYGTGAAPEVFAYRVYPAAGLWPRGHPGRASAAATVAQLVRSVPLLLRQRALRLRAPDAAPAKVRAINQHASQKRLLDGELRYVWGTDVELFRPLDPASA